VCNKNGLFFYITPVKFTRDRFSDLLFICICRRCPLIELGLHFIDTCQVQLLSEIRNGKLSLIFCAKLLKVCDFLQSLIQAVK